MSKTNFSAFLFEKQKDQNEEKNWKKNKMKIVFSSFYCIFLQVMYDSPHK